jgi:hypothetical protein
VRQSKHAFYPHGYWKRVAQLIHMGEWRVSHGEAADGHVADLARQLRDAGCARVSVQRRLFDRRLLQKREIDCGGSTAAATPRRRSCELDVEGRNAHDAGAVADQRPLRECRDATHVLPGHMSKFVRSLYRAREQARSLLVRIRALHERRHGDMQGRRATKRAGTS